MISRSDVKWACGLIIFWVLFSAAIIALSGCFSSPASTPGTLPSLPPVTGANISAIASLGWMISLLVALFVVGVVLLGLRQIILGGALVLGALAGVILAIAIAKYAWLVGIVGAIALCTGAIVVGRKLWVNYWTTREAIRIAETAKVHLTAENRQLIFGPNGTADIVQTPAVKKEIKKVRRTLGFAK